MHDIRTLRADPGRFDERLARRGLPPLSAAVLALDSEVRRIQTELQEMQARRNDASRAIGQAKAAGRAGEAEALLREVAELKQRLLELEARERALGAEIAATLAAVPNLPADDVPEGADEAANLLVHARGEPRALGFDALEHDMLAEPLGYRPAKATAVAGARFAVLEGPLARLERAIGQFMLDLQTVEHGYTEVSVPLLVRQEAMFGTGQLPKFGEESFRTTDGRWLIPTAEVSLTNLVRETILDAAELPMRLTALTPCFRSEAGAAGRDTRGLIRQHQFLKVELVSITEPERSTEEHERMTACAEAVLDRLELPYRRMLLSTGDMGFSATKTYDLEVWLPGQGRYREISSCSNCGDFQARRMDARYRRSEVRGTGFVHTLNGSGLAVGRTLVAILENCQQPDGSVVLPVAIRPYMGGVDRLEPR